MVGIWGEPRRKSGITQWQQCLGLTIAAKWQKKNNPPSSICQKNTKANA